MPTETNPSDPQIAALRLTVHIDTDGKYYAHCEGWAQDDPSIVAESNRFDTSRGAAGAALDIALRARPDMTTRQPIKHNPTCYTLPPPTPAENDCRACAAGVSLYHPGAMDEDAADPDMVALMRRVRD